MLGKYYSLDECGNVKVVLDKLQQMQDDGKIYFSNLDQDVLKIKDSDLTAKETKELVSFFEKNDVIEYLDYEDIYGDDEFDDEYEEDEDGDEEYEF